MALLHIRESCVGIQGSHHSHQWLVGAWRMLNFSPSRIVWRSTGLFRAEDPGIRRTFLHRLHEATRSSVGCSLESVHSSLSSQFLIPLDSYYNYIINWHYSSINYYNFWSIPDSCRRPNIFIYNQCTTHYSLCYQLGRSLPYSFNAKTLKGWSEREVKNGCMWNCFSLHLSSLTHRFCNIPIWCIALHIFLNVKRVLKEL